jgi:dolichol-phosphate mannosyltransferase
MKSQTLTDNNQNSINSPSSISRQDVTIVLPTLNEAVAIGSLIDEIHANGYYKILVVDGFSNDGTCSIAQAHGATVAGQHGKGKSGAILVARDIVDTPFFLIMDGDSTYDPSDIDRFVAYANAYDEIIGFRPKQSPNISRTHRFGNWILTHTFNLFMGSNVPDVACGMYLMRTDKIKTFELTRLGFEIDQEIAVQMLTDGKVTYVPINYRARKGAVKAPTWRQGFRALFAIINLGRLYSPSLLFSLLASLALIPAVALIGYAIMLYLFFDEYHGGYILASLVLFTLGSQGLTVATIASITQRLERKVNRLNSK